MEISPIESVARASALVTGRAIGPVAAEGFAEALGKALASVNETQQQAQTLARRFQLNDPGVTLEETMIALQTASISFQALVQARNRLLSAYHDIMNIQV